MQVAACEALSANTDSYVAQTRAKYKSRAEFLVGLLKSELAWEAEIPKGSMYIWTKLPQQFSHLTSFEFCKKLVEATGVALSPGSGFGDNGEGFVRFSLIRDEEKMTQAVAKMKSFYESSK